MRKETSTTAISFPECPCEGDGVNHWTFIAAISLKDAGFTKDQAREQLCEKTSRTDEGKAQAEIERALDKIYSSSSRPRTSQPKFPSRNPTLISKVVDPSNTLETLSDLASPPLPNNPDDAIDALFPGNPFLCIGKGKFQFRTLRKDQWKRRLDNMEFITPNPMTAEFGRTKTGKISAHTADNTGPRVFQVIECDPQRWEDLPHNDQRKQLSREAYRKQAKNEQAAIAIHLMEMGAKVACVVDSGGKSLHTWVYVEQMDEVDQFNLFQYSCGLGADPRMWLSFQFARLPGGLRRSGAPQRILYFDADFSARRQA